MSRLLFLIAGILIAGAAAAQSPAANRRPEQGALKVGEPAPTFVLRDVEDRLTVDLARNGGRPTVLIFGSCT